MKVHHALMLSLTLALGCVSCASLNAGESSKEKLADNPDISSTKTWTSADHLAAAKNEAQKAERLEIKIENIQNQIDELNKQPYLDTKGFRRASLRVLKGDLIKEVKELTQKITWHKAQAKEILTSQGQFSKDS